jgi:Protein of unknown function (DUF1064)
MRGERRGEREAWTAYVEGRQAAAANKYGVAPKWERGKYASKHEAAVAASLAALATAGKIRELREQHPIVLVPGDGKLRPIKYIADFTYIDLEGRLHILDAKGFKTQVYRLKKRLAALLLHIEIEEV